MSTAPQQPQRIAAEHHIDLGAQVGIERNNAFASGGRTHRITTSAYTLARPTYDAPRGLVIGVTQLQAAQ